MTNEQKCHVTIEPKDDYYCFVLTKQKWNSLKKKVEREFSRKVDDEWYDYSEVRFYLNKEDQQVDVEGHCLLNHKRKR